MSPVKIRCGRFASTITLSVQRARAERLRRFRPSAVRLRVPLCIGVVFALARPPSTNKVRAKFLTRRNRAVYVPRRFEVREERLFRGLGIFSPRSRQRIEFLPAHRDTRKWTLGNFMHGSCKRVNVLRSV